MTTTVKMRGRPTRLLLELAVERFNGCDQCPKDSYDCLDDVLKPLRLSKREAQRLNQKLSCPGCDAPLTLSDYVTAYSDEELRHHKRFARWCEQYSPKVNAFESFSAEMQRKITKALKRAHVTVLEPRTWYRCLSTEPKSAADCFPQNFQRPSRFNHIAQLAFYLAAEKETAAIEASQDRTPEERNDPVWVVEVTVENKLKVLDVGQPFPGYRKKQDSAFLQGLIQSSFLRRPKTGDKPMHSEYLLT
jgi:hypothetical protein